MSPGPHEPGTPYQVPPLKGQLNTHDIMYPHNRKEFTYPQLNLNDHDLIMALCN